MAVKREKVIKTAEKLVSRGRVEAAIREYRKLLQEAPNDSNTLNRVGDLYARINRIDEAVRLFTQIAEQYSEQGFFVKAIAIYKKIIKLDPTRLEVYEKLADLYHKQGLVNEARTQYQVLADYYLKHDNQASALNIYQRMVELEPDDPSHHAKLAELYQQQRLLDKAMAQYRIIADIMTRHGHVDEAVQVFERALEISSEDLEFIREAAEALHGAGHGAAAARFLARAQDRNPKAAALAAELDLEPPAEPPSEPAAAEAAPPPSPAESAPLAAGLYEDLEEDGEEEGDESARSPAAGFGVSDEMSAALDEAASFMDGEEPEDFFAESGGDLDEFVIDWDEEEPPASLVTPPPDMLEEPVDAATAAPPREAVEEAGEESPQESTGTWEFDLDELEVETPGVSGEEPPAAEAALAEAAVPEAAAETARVEDIFTEAEVLARYGLQNKAQERLEELLALDPRHLEGMALLIRIHLDADRREEAAALAASMAAVAGESRRREEWEQVREELEKAGFEFDGDRVVPASELAAPEPAAEPEVAEPSAPAVQPPPPPPRRRRSRADDEQINRLLRDLLEEEPRSRKRPPAAAAPPPSQEAVFEAEIDFPEEAEAEAMAEPPPMPAIDLDDESDIDEALASIKPIVPPPPAAPPAPAPAPSSPAPPPPPPAAAAGDDASWLDEVSAARGETPAPDAEGLFDDEEDFFNLAAELEEELDADDLVLRASGTGEDAPREQSLEEIVEGFKRGVAENLSEEDYDTHFNLGIAYREMGLLDEAIGEFQLAAKDPQRLVECCSMLGLCFLDKGLPELAIKWYQRALASPGLSEDDHLALLYELGDLHLANSDEDRAYQTFVEIYGANSNYRDVVARLTELRPGGPR